MPLQVKGISDVLNDGAKCVVTLAPLQTEGQERISSMINQLQELIIARKYLFVLLKDTSKSANISQLQGNVLQVQHLRGMFSRF